MNTLGGERITLISAVFCVERIWCLLLDIGCQEIKIYNGYLTSV